MEDTSRPSAASGLRPPQIPHSQPHVSAGVSPCLSRFISARYCPRSGPYACARRTAAPLCTAGGGGGPTVPAARAEPSYPPPGPGEQLLRRQRGVGLIIPLLSQGGEEGREAVFPAGQPSGAVGTALAPCAALGHLHLPLVLFLTDPPDLLAALRRHIPGRQRTVFSGMPLLRQLGIHGGQAVVIADLPVDAVGAARMIDLPVVYAGAKGVALFTAPPDRFGRSGGDIPGGQAAVFLRVPLVRQRRIDSGQAVLSADPAVAAVGAEAGGGRFAMLLGAPCHSWPS